MIESGQIKIIPMTRCARCGEDKADDQFYENPRKRNGLSSYCRACSSRISKEHSKKRMTSFWQSQGVTITPLQHAQCLVNQGGKCAICGIMPAPDERQLCVDHDHRTKAFRGLICNSCNIGLGSFRDDPEALRAAIDYIEGTSRTRVGTQKATENDALGD